MAPTGPQQTDNFFEAIEDPALQELALAVRHIIKQTLPQVEEGIKWAVPFYMYQGNLCYIQVRRQNLELGFYRGVHLSNANGLLRGDGKLVKHIIFSPEEDIPLKQLQEVLLEAATLNEQGPLKMK